MVNYLVSSQPRAGFWKAYPKRTTRKRGNAYSQSILPPICGRIAPEFKVGNRSIVTMSARKLAIVFGKPLIEMDKISSEKTARAQREYLL